MCKHLSLSLRLCTKNYFFHKMVSCSVGCCENKGLKSKLKIDGTTYHKFPRDPRRKILWVNAIKKADSWIPAKGSVICSAHFEEKYFYFSEQGRRLLNPKAVPSLFLPVVSIFTEFIFENDMCNCLYKHRYNDRKTVFCSPSGSGIISDRITRAWMPVWSPWLFKEATVDISTQTDSDWFHEPVLGEITPFSKPSTSVSTTPEIVPFCIPDEDLKVQSDDTPQIKKLKYAVRRYKILYERNKQKVKRLTETKRRCAKTIKELKSALSSVQQPKLPEQEIPEQDLIV